MEDTTTTERPVKVCTKCLGEYPPTTEFFAPHKQGRLGLDPSCRTCRYDQIGKRRKLLLDARLCVVCAKTPALPDRAQCGPCNDEALRVVRKCKDNRRKTGYCADCGKMFAAVGSSRCLTCQARRRELGSNLRSQASARGLCAHCKARPPAPHALRCVECLEKTQRACKGRSKRLKDAGLCKDCGRLPLIAGLSRCIECYTRDRAYSRQLKQDTFSAYGGKCACCGESNMGFLTMDHTNNDGFLEKLPSGQRASGHELYKKLKDAGFPRESYQVLCWNCNLGKAHRNGICPHKE